MTVNFPFIVGEYGCASLASAVRIVAAFPALNKCPIIVNQGVPCYGAILVEKNSEEIVVICAELGAIELYVNKEAFAYAYNVPMSTVDADPSASE